VGGSRETSTPDSLAEGLLLASADLSAHASSKRYCTCLCPGPDPEKSNRVIELTSILILHRMTSPQWLKHLKTGISGLEDVAESQLASLAAGDALVWAQRSTDKRFTQRPYKVQIRPTIQPSRRWNENGGPKCNRQMM
jgi:hypothetical protein